MPAACGVSRAPDAIKPPLKWAGGKTRLLPALLKRVPKNIAELRYVEPFLGGGALFFALRPKTAILGDLNENLIEALRAVRDQRDGVVHELRALVAAHSFETFQTTRELLSNPDLPADALAAAFFYLNRTAFNGLYRVNKAGKFNVPFGKYKNPRILDEAMLVQVGDALHHAQLFVSDFESLTKGMGYGDFIYFDPPYVPTSETANFTSYTSSGFDTAAQERLAGVFRDRAHRGAYVMLSQSNTPLVRKLYKGFHISKVENSRSISCKGDGRGKVSELIIRNYR